MSKSKRSRIQKDAEATAPAPEFELTNIDTREISLVDAAANRRKFLLTKRERSMRAPTDTEKAAEEAAKAAEEAAKAAEEATAAEEAAKAAAATAVEEAAKAAAATAAKEAAPIAVEIEPSPSSAPQATIDNVKAAILAGIDKISERLNKFREDVNASEATGTDGFPSAVWDHAGYIRAMLEELYRVGGPAWDMEAAMDAAIKSADITKGHKAITMARVHKLRAVHKMINYACKDMGGIMDELDAEGASLPSAGTTADEEELSFAAKAAAATAVEEAAKAAAVTAAEEAAKAAAVTDAEEAAKAAAVTAAEEAAKAAAPDPRFAEMAKAIEDLRKMTQAQAQTIATQGAALSKAAGTIRPSAQEILSEVGTDYAKVAWPRDMASTVGTRKGHGF